MLREIVLCCAVAVCGRAVGASPIGFRLDADSTTSAGVYAADGTLVRTLWSGQFHRAGRHRSSWDLLDDAGQAAGSGPFEVRVLAHRVHYVWEGVVGNTSARAPWEGVHRSFGVPTSLLAQRDAMLYAVGYNEGQSAINGFSLDQPQRSRSTIRHVDPFVSAAMLAADDRRVYWVNGGGLSKTTFIGVFDGTTGRQGTFDAGVALCLNRMPGGACYPEQDYRSVIGVRGPEGDRATGIAVQRAGPVLAVAWAREQRVHLFDKQTGRTLASIEAPLRAGATNQLAITPAGDLWVLGPQEARRYTDLEALPRVAARITGLSRPLAVTVDPRDEDAVWIAEGAQVQQIRRVDRNGVPRATVGAEGGMRDRSAPVDDRFCFFTSVEDEATALAVALDGALWAVDTCNTRIVRIGAGGRIADQVAWLPASYVATVDSGRPSRVFANFLEFEVDGERPIDQPGAWRLVRNWLPVLPSALRDAHSHNDHWGGFRLVRTLTNGRTYAMLPAHGMNHLVELTAEGRVRRIGPWPNASRSGTLPYLYENGDLGDAVLLDGFQQVRRQRLKGFDAQGDPVWTGRWERIASAPAGPRTPHHRLGAFTGVAPPQFPVTGSGQVVYFDPSVTGNEGFHLGAVRLGSDRWAWQASPSGPMDGRGTFQTRAVDGSIHYGGNAVMCDGTSIIYGYHGEFYMDQATGRVGQANQFVHFHESGLFVGQFGTPSTRSSPLAEPGKSGNAFSPTLVRHAGRTYLYHNDESTFGGVHRWRLDHLESMVVLRGTGKAGELIEVR